CRPLRPRGVQHRYVPELRCRHGLRRLTTGSAIPTLPQSVPRGFPISWLHWFASATACQVARPPVRIGLDRPAFGDLPSRPEELHLEPLTDPDLTLSRHPARATACRLPLCIGCQV